MHRIERHITLPITLEQAWEFFSSPRNLKTITPPYMGFEIESELPAKMYAGQIIRYTVKPLLHIPMTWVTEISQVKELEMFVDEQRFGPYAFWHHKHFFKETEGGVHVTDIVDYKVPMGPLGRWIEPFLVRPRLEEIFDFRENKLTSLFGSAVEPSNNP